MSVKVTVKYSVVPLKQKTMVRSPVWFYTCYPATMGLGSVMASNSRATGVRLCIRTTKNKS